MKNTGKYIMFVNPHAGKKQGLVQAEKAVKFFADRGIESEMLISRFPGEILTLAKDIRWENCRGILAVGGDGTLFEVLNGVLKNHRDINIPFGLIPVGTGNSFIKDLGINSTEEALEKIEVGNTKRVDVGYFTYEKGSHYFINLLGGGFVSNVAYRAKKYKALGALSYIFGVLEEITVLKSTSIEMEIDGEKIVREGLFFEICNSRYTGGDMMMAPGALIDDGLFDVVVMNRTSRIKLLKLFPAIFKGTHVNDPVIEVFRGKKISLKTGIPFLLTPDGETFGNTPLEAEILPGKISMFC
jgi:diacylglycerol kinase (ATP)